MSFSNDLTLGFDPAGKPVILRKEFRPRHCVCIGPTGVGKSKLLESLIRQDLVAWPKTRCGLALFDPHGSVVDSIIAFAAAAGLDNLPIVPFDCRRLDYILSFNPMRPRPGIESATIISSCIDAFLHAWQQWDFGNQTPRLEKWLRVMLMTIFLSGGTMSDLLILLRSPDLRRAMARNMEDDVARTVWQSATSLKEAEFQTLTESLCNRVIRFVSATMLRLTLNQSGPSLDFGTVLEKGQIVLISLATAGGVIDDVDARTLGALLLQDLWTAARVRGKGEAGQKRSFRVYIDEFSRFLTPTMAEGLAEARGFGLELFFACQSTTQLQATPAGEQVLNAVLANAYTKIVFNVQHAADLDTFGPMLFRHNVNTEEIKRQDSSTRVLGHDLRYMESTSRSVSRGTSDTANWSTTESTSQATSSSRSCSQGRTKQHGSQITRSSGQTRGTSQGINRGQSSSVAESEARGTTESRATARSSQEGSSESESRHLDGGYDDMAKIVGPEPTTTFQRAYIDEDEEHRRLNRTLDQSKASSQGTTDSESAGMAATQSKSQARAVQESHSSSESRTASESESAGDGESDSESIQTTDSISAGETSTTGTSESLGGSRTESEATTEGTTLSPMLFPVLGQENLPPMYRSTEEQLFIHAQRLSSLPDRHAIVRTGSTSPPVEITTPTLPTPKISPKGVRAWATLRLKKLSFALPVAEATKRLAERQQSIEAKYLGPGSTDEPTTTARRIKE